MVVWRIFYPEKHLRKLSFLIDVIVEQLSSEIHPQALIDVIQACGRNNVDAAYKNEYTNFSYKSVWDSRNKFAKGILERLLDFGQWKLDNEF